MPAIVRAHAGLPRSALRRKREIFSARPWEKTVPDDFQFAIKGSRYCVSRSKLAESAESISNFFGQGFEVLGPKLGPILWQFARFRKFNRDDIAAFIDLLPERLDGIALRHAIEPRHESFRDDKFFDLCRARNIAVVLEDSDDYPTIEADTADFAYARLQRMPQPDQTRHPHGDVRQEFLLRTGNDFDEAGDWEAGPDLYSPAEIA